MMSLDAMYGEEESKGDSRRFLFTLELKAGSRTNYEWTPEIAMKSYLPPLQVPEDMSLRHILVLKQVILGQGAKENETNLITIEVDDADEAVPDKAPVMFPLAHLKKGQEPQRTLDFTLPENPALKATFTLAEGSGPLHVVGYHFIERYMADGEESEAEEDMEDEYDGEMDEKNGENVKPTAIKRRLAENGNGDNGDMMTPKKRARLQMWKTKNGKGENGAGNKEDTDAKMENAEEAEKAETEAK